MSVKTKFVFRGKEYSIEHLAPDIFLCPCKEINRDIIVAFSFTNHCYTRAFEDKIHKKEEIMLYESARPRVFCPERHGLSHRLPQIVSSLPKQTVHQTYEGRNYVFSSRIDLEGASYDVFFMLQRARAGSHDLRLTVESAYMSNSRRGTAGAVRFTVLAHHTFVGKSLKFARR